MILDLAMPVTAANQSVHDGLGSEPITIFSADYSPDLSYLTGYQTDLDPHTEKEHMLDIKILAGSCLYGVGNAEELSAMLSFPPPSLMTESTAVYSVKQRNFAIHLIIMMLEVALGSLRRTLDTLPEPV